jgi:hypothetical protein
VLGGALRPPWNLRQNFKHLIIIRLMLLQQLKSLVTEVLDLMFVNRQDTFFLKTDTLYISAKIHFTKINFKILKGSRAHNF